MSSSDTLEQQINRNVDTIKSQLEDILGIIKDNKDKTLSEKELKILKNIETTLQGPNSGSIIFSILIIFPSAGDTITLSLLATLLVGSLKKFKQNNKNETTVKGTNTGVLYDS